jgi:DNA-directed RNA polymerase subunit RPC12/RpoP
VITKFIPNHYGVRHLHVGGSRIQADYYVDAYCSIPVPNPNHLLIPPLLHDKIKMTAYPATTLYANSFTSNLETFFLEVSNRVICQTQTRLLFFSPAHPKYALPIMLSKRVWKSLSLEKTKMTATTVIECSKCKGLLLATKSQKTRICPYCGAKVNVQKAKHLATAQDAFQASQILRKLKTERQTNPGKPISTKK